MGVGQILAGTFHSYSFLAKFSSTLEEEWFRTYSFEPFEQNVTKVNELRDVEELDSGGFAVSGLYLEQDLNDEENGIPWLIVTDECGLIQQDCTISVPSLPAAGIKVFPNPTGGWLNIPQEFIGHNFRLVNAEGKLVDHGQFTFAGFDLTEFNEGLYVLSIEQDNGNWVNTSVVKK